MVKTSKSLPLAPASLYIHVPFCTKKCPYCHFFVLPNRQELQQQYLKALLREWELQKTLFKNKTLISLYFGGGTPSLLSPKALEQILAAIHQECASSAIEVTIEANPETLSLELAQCFKQLGFNRLSLGVQSLDPHLLKHLGRTHSDLQALQAVELCQKAGFDNLSIDLMYDLPFQTMESWRHTLEIASQLPITHLSLYNLVLEPPSLFYSKSHLIQRHQPDPQLSSDMYLSAQETLQQAGLIQYEISAFAKPGFEAVHNSGYWTARPFIGLGPSAFSEWEARRFRNIAHLNKYCQSLARKELPVDFQETLSQEAKAAERLILSLRLRKGTTEFTPSPQIDKLQTLGLLEVVNGSLRLTDKGVLFYDEVASELVVLPK